MDTREDRAEVRFLCFGNEETKLVIPGVQLMEGTALLTKDWMSFSCPRVRKRGGSRRLRMRRLMVKNCPDLLRIILFDSRGS